MAIHDILIDGRVYRVHDSGQVEILDQFGWSRFFMTSKSQDRKTIVKEIREKVNGKKRMAGSAQDVRDGH
jgi:hypothetical protein